MISFDRKKFCALKNKFTVKSIKLLLIDYIIEAKNVNDFEINEISSLEDIRDNSILFYNKSSMKLVKKFNNVLFITDVLDKYKEMRFTSSFLVKNLDKTFNHVTNHMFSHDDSLDYKDDYNLIEHSYISKYADIHPSAKIGSNCVIGKGVEIGCNSIIKNNTVIKNSIIKDNVIISDNTTIGCTGFGFDLKNMGSKNLNPHIGIVYIDDDVVIGSNCTIDRGKIDVTYIGKKSMIDNLVHIAHNVKIGNSACIAAQSGISGSTIIGDNLVVGGQTGFAGHIRVGNNVIVAGRSGVTKNIPDNSIIAGFPAIDINKWKKNIIKNRKK
jgi:UDP-3-O-[3-hydroxymyristoyl] glucosamine N-acyltransferase